MHRLFLIVLALGLPASIARPGLQMSAANKTVRAGETVTLRIKLDKAPNFAGGQVAVRIGPKNSSADSVLRTANMGVKDGQTEFFISMAIPLGGPVGVWRVENLTFTLPNGDARPLKFDDMDFTVAPRTELVVPDSATLRIE